MKFTLNTFLIAFLSVSCSSQPTFKPEVGGKGSELAKDGVVYSIPAQNPVLRMKLVSLGITKNNMLRVQMYFLRLGPPAQEFLDPREQMVFLPESTEAIYPAKVHASAAGKPLIKLVAAGKQGVELLYPVPGEGHHFPYIKLNWKIHYTLNGAKQTMNETERFDINESATTQRGVGQYDSYMGFPYFGMDASGDLARDWITPDWLWW